MARAVVRVMRVEFHIGAAIKGVQPPEQALQRVGLEEGMVLGHAGNVYRELIVCNERKKKKKERPLEFSPRLRLDYYYGRKAVKRDGGGGDRVGRLSGLTRALFM